MREFIPVEEVAKDWMKDRRSSPLMTLLEDEFAMASALINARRDADLTRD
jgi:hypothetical protein